MHVESFRDEAGKGDVKLYCYTHTPGLGAFKPVPGVKYSAAPELLYFALNAISPKDYSGSWGSPE